MTFPVQEFAKETAITFFKLGIAGVTIGLLHQYDLVLALLLIFSCVRKKFRETIRFNGVTNWMLVIGMILTGVAGVIGEIGGITLGYWEYHDLSRGREFPYWLPFAWMLTFYFIYSYEKKIIVLLSLDTLFSKIMLAVCVALTFPVLGEIITINLGVWTYYWPFKLLGIPVYAILALVFIHVFIHLILTQVAKKYGHKDIAFN